MSAFAEKPARVVTELPPEFTLMLAGEAEPRVETVAAVFYHLYHLIVLVH